MDGWMLGPDGGAARARAGRAHPADVVLRLEADLAARGRADHAEARAHVHVHVHVHVHAYAHAYGHA